MSSVLVTGGTGTLGAHLVPLLRGHGHDVRVLSRHAGDARVVGDLDTGEGVAAAVDGAEVIVHAASSSSSRTVDVSGTRCLVAAARAAGVGHLVQVSIVGVDRNPFRYYRAKLAAEQVVGDGGVPHTVARGTQFYELIVAMAARFSIGPVVLAPRGWRLQPAASADFAAHLARRVQAGPAAAITEFGGPQELTAAELLRDLHGGRVREVPFPGRVSAAFRAGAQVPAATAERGTTTWRDWLASR